MLGLLPEKEALSEVEKLPKNEYLKDSGVKLANEYAELAERRTVINRKRREDGGGDHRRRNGKVRRGDLKYATKHRIEAIQGSETQVVISIKKKNYAFSHQVIRLGKIHDAGKFIKRNKILGVRFVY